MNPLNYDASVLIIPCVAASVIIVFLVIENLLFMAKQIKRERERDKKRKELDKVLRNKKND